MPGSLSRKRPVVSRCMEQITEIIATHALVPGDRLPSIRTLASSTGASMVTVSKALHALCDTGLVQKSGPRSFAVKGNPAAPDKSAPAVREILRPREGVAAAIRKDICNGFFPPGKDLPFMKEMLHRYRTSHRTIRKALDSLVSSEIIDQSANGRFCVPALASTCWLPRIVCLVESIDSYTMAFGRNDEALFRALETVCEQAHTRLDVYLVFADLDLMDHRLRHRDSGQICDAEELARITDDKSVLGYVYLIPWKPERIARRIIEALSRLRKPLAVVDETSLLQLPDKKWVKRFTVATGNKPSQSIAHHLRSLGHRHVAYVSGDHQHDWSQSRLRELSQLFHSLGGTVLAFVAEADVWPFHVSSKQCDFAALDRFYARWRDGLLPPYRTEIDRAIDRMRVEAHTRGGHRMVILPLLEQALAVPEITAWVAVNDDTASLMLEFLKEKGRRVPQDLSVISFDDSAEAMRNNLSSYNFNTAAIAMGIIGFILKRKPFSDPDWGETGFIVKRGSTRAI